jgi:hypothetical protein
MPVERVTKPSDWLHAVEDVATTAISGVDPYKVGKVKYEAGAQVGPDEACLGVLAIDVVTWVVTAEPWPRPRQPSEPRNPVGEALVMNVNVKYVTCVTGPNAQGGPPAAATAAAEQVGIMDLAWVVFTAFLDAEAVWAKHLGIARANRATRLPDVGGASGFQMDVQCKLAAHCR